MGRSLRVVLVDWPSLVDGQLERHLEWPSVPAAWCTDYPPLSYVGAGKDLLWLSLNWDSVRDALGSEERERFDRFFRRIGWNPDDYAGTVGAGGKDLYRDIEIHVSCGRMIVLGPDTIATLLDWWRGDLVHRWESLRPAYTAHVGADRFAGFDGFTTFVLRWVEALEVAARAGRGLVGAYD